MSEQEQRFAARVRHIRKLRELSQEELGKRAGMSRSLVANIEIGRREGITIAEAASLCEALGVELEQMLSMEPMKLRIDLAVD